jgi:hypothetical protein
VADVHNLQRRFIGHGQLLAVAAVLTWLISSLCPDGPDKRVAIDRLQESMIWAGAAMMGRRGEEGKGR